MERKIKNSATRTKEEVAPARNFFSHISQKFNGVDVIYPYL
jgi:hypothetical protein